MEGHLPLEGYNIYAPDKSEKNWLRVEEI